MDCRSPVTSVIIPFLDPPRNFIQAAIESVLTQADQSLELILVDDGSRQSLVEQLRSHYRSCDVPMRWIRHPAGANEGVSASRNLGISVARGDYIAFLDADDQWLPGKLARQIEIMESNAEICLVFGQTLYYTDEQTGGEGGLKSFVPWHGDTKPTQYVPPLYLTRLLRGRAIAPSISNFLVRRDALQRCGGFENEFRSLYEDQVFFAKMCLHGVVCAVPECWDRYRQHPHSMTAVAERKRDGAMARKRFLVWLADYCRENAISDPALWEALAKSMWLNAADCRRAANEGYGVSRWARSRLLRLEETVVPSPVRQRFWNADRVMQLGANSPTGSSTD